MKHCDSSFSVVAGIIVGPLKNTIVLTTRILENFDSRYFYFVVSTNTDH